MIRLRQPQIEYLLINNKYNRPGAQKLLQLTRTEGIQATSKDIKELLSSRSQEQQLNLLFKRQKKYKTDPWAYCELQPMKQTTIRYICIKKI